MIGAEASKIPPVAVRAPVPRAELLPSENVPAESVAPPLNVFAAVSVKTCAALLKLSQLVCDNAPVPESTPEIVPKLFAVNCEVRFVEPPVLSKVPPSNVRLLLTA